MLFRFFAEGLPYPLTFVYFYVEGLGFVIALIFFYRALVMGGGQLPVRIFEMFETPIIDRSLNERIARGVLSLSHALRRIHTGSLNAYLIWVIIGLLMIVLLILIATGSMGGS